MLTMSLISAPGAALDSEQLRDGLTRGLGNGRYTGARVLVLIPDGTRTIPLPLLFPIVVDALHDAKQLDFMIALGTHPPMPDDAILNMLGLSADSRATTYGHIGLLNHAWDDPATLVQIGTLTQARVQAIAGAIWHPSLGSDVPIRINSHIFDYDQIVILGPTFPHEVVGFSGGAKYLFPGISGPEMINVTHWLSALNTAARTIGIKETPVRTMINEAAAAVTVPITLAALVVEPDSTVSGLFIGDHLAAWSAAADFSAQRHIIWLDSPYQQVLSHAPAMYDELWTCGKAMYKLEPAIADGGEVIIYAPHLRVVSRVHGRYIAQIGYHVRDYFLNQWDRFADMPLSVLAHSNHVRGAGTYENGIEHARITVTLASQIPADDCRALNLGYRDPASIDPAAYKNREADGVLYVPKAGEMLYRLRD